MSPLFNALFVSRRFYRNFTNSHSSKPGFMFFESVQKLNRTRPTTISESEIELPESLGALFKNFDQNKPLPNLKGPLHPSQIDRLVSAYPNQSRPNVINLLNITQSKQSIFSNFELSSINLTSEPISLQSLADSLQEQFHSEAIECANVLKKRRRRMRGHKHKKRLKERRHKANK